MTINNKIEMENYILKGPDKHVDVHDKGLGWHFFELMQKHKERIMQVCSETGIKERFGDVLKRAIRVALEMKKRGVTSNDVISMCSYNHLNSCVPVIAAMLLNCKSACMDPTISESDTKHLISLIKPKFLFIGQEAEELITNVLSDADFSTEVISFGTNTKYEKFINFLKPKEEEDQFQPVVAGNLKDTILIFFSSGSTGLPKGICLHHYGVMKNMFVGINKAMSDVSGTLMSFASQYWISTFSLLYMSVQLGIPRVLVPYFHSKKAWDVIDIFKPFLLFAAPCQLLEMLDGKGVPPGKNVDSIKLIATGGHSISPDQLDYVRSNFPKCLVGVGYGQTEASGAITLFDVASMKGLQMMMAKKSSCGTLVPGMMYKVIDDNGNLCGPNERGELHIKADYLMAGYYNMDSSSAWDEDGWLKTGDVVYYDNDKHFYIVDRTKDMLKYKSWHVVPAKLESVISNHSDVVNVVVFGIPHPLDGDHPCAAVKLKSDATVTAEELQKFADDQLDERQKLRGGVKIVDEFPTTPTGKISRRLIRDYILSKN